MAAIDAYFPLGSKWVVLDTERNGRNGLKPQTSAYLTFADATHFSVEVLQPGQPHLKIPRSLFGEAFARGLDGAVNAGYKGSSHARTAYK